MSAINPCIFTIIVALLLSLSSCSEPSKEIGQALKLAGENKAELQKVIDHYQAPKDSLKLKAALFLIGNMDSHYYKTIAPREKWERVLRASDSLIKNKIPDYKKKIKDMFYSQGNLIASPRLDVQTIKAKDLITNIELAFKVWPQPWNDFLDFDGFCNFILPYRSKNEPFTKNFRTQSHNELFELISNTNSKDILTTIDRLSPLENGGRLIKLFPTDLAISDIEKGKMADCIDATNYVIAKGRAVGIPMAMDFTFWANGRSSHYWNAFLYSKDSLQRADSMFFWGSPGTYKTRNKVAKIYRFMYSKQDQNIKNKEINTFLNSPYIQDVTSQYIKTTNIKLTLNKNEGKKYTKAYLCIFNDRKWTPIAVTKINNENKVSFPDVGRENIFVIAAYRNHRIIPLHDILSLDKTGNIQTYIIDNNKTESVILKRKANKSKSLDWVTSSMLHSSFEVSNHSNFKEYQTIYKPQPGDDLNNGRPIKVTLNLDHSFRYFRFKTEIKDWLTLAEMAVYSKGKKIEGKVIYSKHFKAENIKPMLKIFDEDLLTFYTAPNAKHSYWVGLDFGKRKELNELFYAPRSDVNYVKPNDVYELFYWNDAWVSLGSKVAKEYFIKYDNVPKGAILWLRNLSEGIEEDLFVYKNNKQSFWYSKN
ncbi:hypothetical protein JL193_04450 [Polaribacter batillariae]|uniref:Discoidin domain-containing protein n=1 Tax=Polaribacter batillariae TaxID=2808900 RepID=A0ABX7SWA8_9FLAO|nr:hypothetical protein [Polaribacter batillariae]QTD38544.1 hypothetical protein JL193_04450 [Polaribacter batillariae]